MPQKKASSDIAGSISAELNLSAPMGRLLELKGFTDASGAKAFLRRNEAFISSPFRIAGMSSGVERISRALTSGEKIYLFSDSDIDGLTSLTIMRFLLSRLGADFEADFTCGDEPYGITRRAVESAAASRAGLFVSLDCGVRDNDEIAFAKSRGIDVIVCDHHDPSEELPDAIIINPKVKTSEYPYRDVAGCGVAFFFALSVLYSYLPVYSKSCSFKTSRGKFRVRNMMLCGEVSGDEKICFHEATCSPESDKSSDMNALAKRAVKNLKGAVASDDFIPDSGEGLAVFASLFSSAKISSFALDVLPFVAIGTVADMVPLTGANRSLVSMGLAAASFCKIPSIVKLRQIAGDSIDPKKISWRVAPLLNTPGRYGKTALTADFLFAQNCDAIYERISDLNKNRRGELKDVVDRLDEIIVPGLSRIACAFDEGILDGLTGLVASKVCESRRLPAIAATRLPGNIIKGSGRAPDGIDFLSVAEKFSHMFLKFGGHPQAFGFSIPEDDFHEFLRLVDEAGHFVSAPPKIKTDCDIDLAEIDRKLAAEISMLSPFGKDNEEPVFFSREIPLTSFTVFGSDSSHGKMLFGQPGAEIIGWKMKDEMKAAYVSGKADIIYRLEENVFNGRSVLRLVLEDILPAGEIF